MESKDVLDQKLEAAKEKQETCHKDLMKTLNEFKHFLEEQEEISKPAQEEQN